MEEWYFGSLPSWERGLKYKLIIIHNNLLIVAPLVGAWIEIPDGRLQRPELLSLPSWERGLKSLATGMSSPRRKVAPLVGAWIEM